MKRGLSFSCAVIVVLSIFSGLASAAATLDRTPPDDVVKYQVGAERTKVTPTMIQGIKAGKDMLVTTDGDRIFYYDLPGLNQLGEIDDPALGGGVSAMDVHFGKTILIYGGFLANLTIYNLTTKTKLFEQPQGSLNEGVRGIAISKDGNYSAVIVSMNPGYNFFVFDLRYLPNSLPLVYGKHLTVSANAVAFSVSNTILIGTFDDPSPTGYELREFDLNGNEVRHFDIGDITVQDVCPNPKDAGEVVLVYQSGSTGGALVQLDPGPPQIKATYSFGGNSYAHRCAFSPNGKSVAIASWKGYFHIFNKTSGDDLRNLTHLINVQINGLAWPEPGNRIYTGSWHTDGGLLRVWKDLIKPTVTRVTTWPSFYVSKTFDIEIEFSEEMMVELGGNSITVTMGPVSPYQNLSINTGSWTDRKTWKGTATLPVGVLEGVNHIKISNAEDRAGNVMDSNANTVVFVDTIDPVVSIASVPYWVDGVLQFTYTIDDGPYQKSSGIKWVSFFCRQSADNITWSAWTNFSYQKDPPLTGTVSFTFPSEGYYQFYAVAMDYAGNSNPTPGITPMLRVGHDITPPVPGISSPPFYQNKTSLVITYSATDNLNMKKLNITERYSADNLTWTPPVEIFNTTSVFIGSTGRSVVSEGFYQYTINAWDERGNMMNATTSLVVDTTAPVTSLTYAGAYWVNGSFNVSYQAMDEYSLCEFAIYIRNSTDNSTWSAWVPVVKKGGPFSGNQTVSPGDDGFYQLGMTATDYSGNTNPLQVSVNVGYDTHPPDVTAQSGSYWSNGTIHILINASDNIMLEEVNISYKHSIDNKSFTGWKHYTEKKVSGKSWNGTIDFTPLDEGYYIIRCTVIDRSGKNTTREILAGADFTPPSTDVSPLPGYTISKSFTVSLGSVSENLSGVKHVELWFRKDNGKATYYGTFSNGTVTFDTNLTGGDGKYTFWSRGYDRAGNAEVVTIRNRGTIVDTVPPSASLITPAHMAKGVPVSTKVVAEFSEPVKDLTFTLSSEGKNISGGLTWLTPTKMEFTPGSSLSYSSRYWVNLTGYDLAGNTLPSYSWWFETESAPPPPVLGSISGHVRNESGAPLSGVRVELRSNGTVIKSVSSNESGFYKIESVQPGVYRIHANLTGYNEFEENVTISSSNLHITLDITLSSSKPPPPEGPNLVDALVTGGTLWWVLLVVVLLVVVILFFALLRKRRHTEPEATKKEPEKDEPAPAPIPEKTGEEKPAPQEKKPEPEGMPETPEKPEKEKVPQESAPASKGFECPICGNMVGATERRCPGCKALIAKDSK